MSEATRTHQVDSRLPEWDAVLAVVAHPDDESFGLGAVLGAFADRGADVAVLCLTQGEASTLHGVDGDLAAIRGRELNEAAKALGINTIRLMAYPDGGLTDVEVSQLSQDVRDLASEIGAQGLVVFDPNGITGHADHMRATEAAELAARELGIGVLAWALPEDVAAVLVSEFGADFRGHPARDVDLVIQVDRARQRAAVECHPSQAVPGSALWRRLALLGDHEHLRWLVPGTP